MRADVDRENAMSSAATTATSPSLRWTNSSPIATDALGGVLRHDAVQPGGVPGKVVDGREVGVESTEASRSGRPRGKRFGTLVHAILAEVELDADADGVGLVAAAQGRIIGASEDEIAAGATAASAALRHPIMRRAAASMKRGECRREAPILLPRGDGTVIEGVIDLAFREVFAGGPEWTVVDFKTDVELTERKDKYATQILLYVQAIRAATGEAAKGVLLSV